MNQALCGNPELQVMDPYVHLSESLEEMKQEHHELLLKLQELHAVTRSIGYDEQVPDWSVKLEGLKDLVEQFRFRFMRHNKKEEATLYPVVDLYTGDKMGQPPLCGRNIEWRWTIFSILLI
ncbi:hemerythrin domain-containing protein [Paenibacillus larvae]